MRGRESRAHAGETLGAFAPRWLDQRQRGGVVRYVKKERSLWDAHVRTWKCYEWPLDRIKRQHVAAFIAGMEHKKKPGGEQLGRGVAKHALSLIRACFRSALDNGLIESNPAVDVRVERRKSTPHRWTFLSLEEIQRVFSVEHFARMDMPHLTLERRAVYAIAIYVGLRKSEILRLRWEDIVLDGPRPSIHVREGKSDHAVRDVPLLPEVREHVRRWRERDGGTRTVGPVFPPASKSRAARSTYHEDYDAGWSDRKAGKGPARTHRDGTASRCNFGRHVRFHDLRHTCASHLVMGSWTPKPLTIQQVRLWLGHGSTLVTDGYAHVSDESLFATLHDS